MPCCMNFVLLYRPLHQRRCAFVEGGTWSPASAYSGFVMPVDSVLRRRVRIRICRLRQLPRISLRRPRCKPWGNQLTLQVGFPSNQTPWIRIQPTRRPPACGLQLSCAARAGSTGAGTTARGRSPLHVRGGRGSKVQIHGDRAIEGNHFVFR